LGVNDLDKEASGTCGNQRLKGGIFLFLTFFNNILKITYPRFYFQGVTLLVTPGQVAQQEKHVTPHVVARQPCIWRDKAVAPSGMARQARLNGQRLVFPVLLPHFLSFLSPWLTPESSRAAPRHQPQILPKSADLEWEK
jgi:hypothetical protein